MAKKTFTPIPPMAELPPAEDINVKELLEKYLSGEIDLICVLGPTASGKPRYAVSLARQINELLASSQDYTPSDGSAAKRTPIAPSGVLLPPAARGVARFPDSQMPLTLYSHRPLLEGKQPKEQR